MGPVTVKPASQYKIPLSFNDKFPVPPTTNPSVNRCNVSNFAILVDKAVSSIEATGKTREPVNVKSSAVIGLTKLDVALTVNVLVKLSPIITCEFKLQLLLKMLLPLNVCELFQVVEPITNSPIEPSFLTALEISAFKARAVAVAVDNGFNKSLVLLLL